MRVLLIDVDSKYPNLALMKISQYHKNLNNQVELKRLRLNPFKKQKVVNLDKFKKSYDIVYASIIFSQNLKKLQWSFDLNIGGSGYSLSKVLPEYIEKLVPDYRLYLPYSWYSIGFITRGCNNKCNFCIVHFKEGDIKFNQHPKNIIKHKFVKFLDNNFLQYSGCNDTLKWLIDNKIKCEFDQGLDIRLISDENACLLSQLNYWGEYYFAFDDIKDKNIIKEKLKILKKYIGKDWKIRFFIYCNPLQSLKDVLYRVDFCKSNKCLCYLMRDKKCYTSINHHFYKDLATYCQLPGIFKKLSFDQYMKIRTKNKERQDKSIKIYNNNII